MNRVDFRHNLGRLIECVGLAARSVPVTGSTRVTTTFDAEEQNSIEMQRDGWHAILNNFKSYVEG